MKDFIFTNVTSDNVDLVLDVIKEKTLIGAYIETDGTILTKEFVSNMKFYALNIILDIECTESMTLNSLARLMRRNPDFEEVLEAIPDNKFMVLKRVNDDLNMDIARLIAITSTFEDYPVLFSSDIAAPMDILSACQTVAEALEQPNLKMPVLREFDADTVEIDANILQYVRGE